MLQFDYKTNQIGAIVFNVHSDEREKYIRLRDRKMSFLDIAKVYELLEEPFIVMGFILNLYKFQVNKLLNCCSSLKCMLC